MKTREKALKLMEEWVQSESLRKHMLCVEAVMKAYAIKLNEDVNEWAIAGLLHDFDYERYPVYDVEKQTGHPFEGVRFLKSQGYSDNILNAILGHALYSGVQRTNNLSKYLFACDELSGFVIACGYLRPDRLNTLTADSVIKRLKDKRFAAKVSREDIELGLSETGLDKREHIEFVISALKGIQDQIFN